MNERTVLPQKTVQCALETEFELLLTHREIHRETNNMASFLPIHYLQIDINLLYILRHTLLRTVHTVNSGSEME